MEPKIVTRDQFNVIGMQYIGNGQNGEMSKLWETFMPRMGEVKNAVNKGLAYGICECMCEGECTCGAGADFYYMACIEVANLDDIPEGMTSKTIPAAKYAVFTHRGSLETIGKTFEDIYCKWIPASGLEPNAKYGFELYDERFKCCAEDSEIDIYVPVK